MTTSESGEESEGMYIVSACSSSHAPSARRKGAQLARCVNPIGFFFFLDRCAAALHCAGEKRRGRAYVRLPRRHARGHDAARLALRQCFGTERHVRTRREACFDEEEGPFGMRVCVCVCVRLSR